MRLVTFEAMRIRAMRVGVRGVLAANSLLAAAIFIGLLIACGAFAQAAPQQRTFPASEAKVQKALHDLHSSTSGRLPILDGFVDTNDSLEHYERGFFQCSVQEHAAANGSTTVQVTAKITAWYADPTGAHAGYRVLASNGRIESDFLDSVGDALGGKSASAGGAPAAGTGARPTGGAAAKANSPAAPAAVGATRAAPAAADGTAKAASDAKATSAPAAPVDGTPTSTVAKMSIEQIRAKRQETDDKVRQLTSQIQNFEQIAHNQSRPDDIAAVTKSGTPIYTSSEPDSEVLMKADAGDEFPIVDVQGAWVHVQISGPSRGWIHRVDLDMPEGFMAGPASGAIVTDAAPLFRVVREDVGPFAGDWTPLKGKVVKIVWVAPLDSAPPQTPPKAKREYAKLLFMRAEREKTAAASALAGVVVIFDSADGGQVAATIDSVKSLASVKIADDSFWAQCSLDPPEAFQDQPKPQ